MTHQTTLASGSVNNTGEIFGETLRRGWRGMLSWGIGIGLLGLVQVVILPDTDALQQMTNLLETMPPIVLQMVGVADLEYMATPEGYIALRFFGLTLLILTFYAVTSGLNVTANDEERGILNLYLSLPVPRWRIVVERTLGYAVMTVGVLILAFLGLVLGIVITPALADVRLVRIAESTLNMLPSLLVALTFTVLVAALTRRRGLVLAIAAAYVVGGYFVDTLGAGASSSLISGLRGATFYYYYDSSAVMQHGLDWGNMLLLMAAALVLLALAVWRFEQRDVGT